ncbi:methyltransferase RsmF C-terminal domain-like protein [Palaeococcus pacificus]|nr:hypothetical protein [Palaeococcus pacificus]
MRGGRKVYAYKNCSFDVKAHVEKGIYFGRVEADGIRLTIEGAFLVGPNATKNVIEIDEEKALKWMSGEDIEAEGEGWVILKWGEYFLGGGKAKNGIVKNYISKDRRIKLE